MRMFFTIAVALMLVAAVTVPAVAVEVEGKIASMDTVERTITLDNGDKLWIGDGVSADNLKEGAEVTISYEEKDGKKVATKVDPKN